MAPTTIDRLGRAVAAALLLAAAGSASAALTQTGVGSYNLGTDSPAGATPSPQTACGSGGQDALIFTGAGVNSIGIHSYSCGFGLYEFGSRSSGENTYYVDGTGSAVGMIGTVGGLSIFVSPGQTGAFGSHAFIAGEYQYAELNVDLVIDGVTYFDERFRVEVGAGGTLTTQYDSNGQLSLANSLTIGDGFASYAITGASYFFDLADGDHSFSYVISSVARGKVTSTTACRAIVLDGGIGEGGGGGVEAAALQLNAVGDGEGNGEGNGEGDGGFTSYCGAGAQIGDPFNDPIARALPEPGSLALLGLAGLMLGLRRRRT